MKRQLLFCVLAYAACTYAGEEPQSLWDIHPIHAGGQFIYLGKADVDKSNSLNLGGELAFRKYTGFVYGMLPISKDHIFYPRIEYTSFEMDWNRNPRFHESHFDYIQFALTYFTTALDKWRWILRADYNVDVKHFTEWGPYGLFSFLLWGTHEIHRKWYWHIGALGYKGMEGAQVYPVIGLEFSPNKKWTFQAIFPIDYSIQYNIDDNWRLSLKGRPLRERFRVGSNEPSPRSIFNYSTIGTEFNVHFQKFLRLEFEAYVGYNFGGTFYSKSQSGHNALYFDVEGTPYIGANLDFGF